MTFGCQMNKYDSLLAEAASGARGGASPATRDADVISSTLLGPRPSRAPVVGRRAEARQSPPSGSRRGVSGAGPRVGERSSPARATSASSPGRARPPPARLVETCSRLEDAPSRSTWTTRSVDRSPTRPARRSRLADRAGCDPDAPSASCPRCAAVFSRRERRPERGNRRRGALDHAPRQTLNSYGEDPAPAAGEPRHRRGRDGRTRLIQAAGDRRPLPPALRDPAPSYVTPSSARRSAIATRPSASCRSPRSRARTGSCARCGAATRPSSTGGRSASCASAYPTSRSGATGSSGSRARPRRTTPRASASSRRRRSARATCSSTTRGRGRSRGKASRTTSEEEGPQPAVPRCERARLNRLSKHVGTVRRAFVEEIGERQPDAPRADDHGLPVSFRGPADLLGREVDVEITGATAFGLAGSMIPEIADSTIAEPEGLVARGPGHASGPPAAIPTELPGR